MRSASLLASILLALTVGGCGSPRPGPNVVRDLAMARDLAQPAGGRDMGVNPPADLAQPPAEDMAKPVGCTKVGAWPAKVPYAEYDEPNGVTYAVTIDKAMLPGNGLLLEDYESPGEKWPKKTTFMPGDVYADCLVCAIYGFCDQMGCDFQYFAQGGTVTVSRADRDTKNGRFTATAQNLRFVEWDFDLDEPVANGKCIEIASASIDVPWMTAAPDMKPTDGGVDQKPADAAMDLKPTDGSVDQKPVDAAMDLRPGDGGADLRPADAAADLAFQGDLALGCTPVVNEVQVEGASASDEFVELYNPCMQAVSLDGWKLGYRSAGNNSGGADTTLLTLTQTIPAGGYLVLAGMGFAGMKDGVLANGLAKGGGAVALKDPFGKRVDSVAYEMLTAANDFTEKAPAPNPPASSSIGRLPSGTDTNDGAKDWKLTAKPTPKAANM